MKRRIHNRVRAARAGRKIDPRDVETVARWETPVGGGSVGVWRPPVPPEDSHADLVRGGPVEPAPAPQRTSEEFLRDMAREDARRRGEALGEPEE